MQKHYHERVVLKKPSATKRRGAGAGWMEVGLVDGAVHSSDDHGYAVDAMPLNDPTDVNRAHVKHGHLLCPRR